MFCDFRLKVFRTVAEMGSFTAAAKELGITYFACGHHATERFGVRALGERIATETDIDVTFIDIDNPV